jgi:hypothetical protein
MVNQLSDIVERLVLCCSLPGHKLGVSEVHTNDFADECCIGGDALDPSGRRLTTISFPPFC